MKNDTESGEDSDPVVETGLAKLANGRRSLGQARYLLLAQDPTASEIRARGAAVTLRSAMDWLEDTEHFEEAHGLLDAVGRFLRTEFGCHFEFADGAYWQTCPVALAHNRVGLSPGFVVDEAQCSICLQDPRTCEHIRGRTYDGERCVRIITKVREILEVSFVARPAQPDARIQRVSVSTKELSESLGDAFRPGVTLNCDRCLSGCDGVHDGW
jgi:hypothetical protein